MAITHFCCPHCGEAFAITPDAWGRAVACPLCGRAMRIPAAEADVNRSMAPPPSEAPKPSDESTAGSGGDASGESLALPDPMAPLRVPPQPAAETVLGQAEDEIIGPLTEDPEETPEAIKVEDRPRTIVYKGRTIELRKVSPEEKRRRRWRRRIILWMIGGGVLIYFLLRGAGKI